MHGGVKVYRGHARGAREYLDQDCPRVDDYYLAEPDAFAQRYTVDADGHVIELARMDDDAYEAWVAGVDPDTAEPRGRLRHDARAVRFVEVTVNGPKSWSLAAELHPDVAAAYDASLDRAAGQIIGWLGQHATARVGPRGQQVATAVEMLEAVTVRHQTSRAGDPHRHLHLQINARVVAKGQWRGLDTVAIRDSIAAINGVGHAAVATDPAFRDALAAHGYTLTRSGEITQLGPYVGAFSKRAAQIERNLARYEKAWRVEHPGEEPGPALRRVWDARAWAEGRPDKIGPISWGDVHDRWLDELTRLGYTDRDHPMLLLTPPVGAIDRDQAVGIVLSRLGAGRSAWNAADIRGEVEHHLARTGIVTDAAVRRELGEDISARAIDRCVPLLDRDGVPEHIRALTSPSVLQIENDLVGRLAVRGAEPGHDLAVPAVAAAAERSRARLNAGQAAAVAALAGDRPLLVVEGAAGAGKTTLIRVTRSLVTEQGHRLNVVTPTLKAAQAATIELRVRASSAAKLAYAHGFRWDADGTWTRLTVGDIDPKTGRVHAGPGDRMRLQHGDLLLVDEAGMLDQDTARALLSIADEAGARIALVGDRHQLAAVGRGGVLDHAARWADVVPIDVIHRFIQEVTDEHGRRRTVPDVEYADLTRAMRTGEQPEAVFDALTQRGQIRTHADVTELHREIADQVVADRKAGRTVAVVASTREQVSELNGVIREAMITGGMVDDTSTVRTRAGERIGVGDVIATRRNDRDLDVANRDTWTVTRVSPDRSLTVTRGDAADRPRGNAARTLPAGYVARHVELAYATTAHGAQGSTTTSAHVVLEDHSTAASAYVAMTRGRHANTAHLVAADIAQARDQWLTTFGRDRADLGPAAARQTAERDAGRYATPEPRPEQTDPTVPVPLLRDLRRAWDVEARCLDFLDAAEPQRDDLRAVTRINLEHATRITPLRAAEQAARAVAEQAEAALRASTTRIDAETASARDAMLAAWDEQRRAAQVHARTVLRGPGRLGLKLLAVNRAQEELARWSVAWQPIIADMPHAHEEIARYADRWENRLRIRTAVENYARTLAETRHSERPVLLAAVQHAREQADHASHAVWDAKGDYHDWLAGHFTVAVPDPDARLTELDQQMTAARDQLARTRARIDQLEQAIRTATREPGPPEAAPGGDHRTADRGPNIGASPVDPITAAREHWSQDRTAREGAAIQRATQRLTDDYVVPPTHSHDRHPPTPDHSREGRSIGM